MAFEGWTDQQIEGLLARCRAAAAACDKAELENCCAILEEQTGLSAIDIIERLAR